MSARAGTAFIDAFDSFCRSLNYTPAQVTANAALQSKLLAVFERAYKRGYNKRLWEDAWDGETVTPTNRLIAFSVIDDARRFEVWDEDPRDPDNSAIELRFTTTLNGILLMDDATSAFVLSMPKSPLLPKESWVTGTVYKVGVRVMKDHAVYRCATAHTAGTFATDLAAVKWVEVTDLEILEVLEEFTLQFAKGTYQLENGLEATGGALRSDALTELETLAMTEYCRTANSAWRPKP